MFFWFPCLLCLFRLSPLFFVLFSLSFFVSVYLSLSLFFCYFFVFVWSSFIGAPAHFDILQSPHAHLQRTVILWLFPEDRFLIVAAPWRKNEDDAKMDVERLKGEVVKMDLDCKENLFQHPGIAHNT